MKYLILFFLLTSAGATELVPLDVLPGKWKSKVKNVGQDMISAMLKQMPDGPEKEKMKKQIDQKLRRAERKNRSYCLKEEEIKNPKAAMKKLTKNKHTKSCAFKLIRSTPKHLDYDVSCQHQGVNIKSTFRFEAKTPKLMVGKGHILPITQGMPDQKFTITSKWLKESCK
jgi:hypothetical protein